MKQETQKPDEQVVENTQNANQVYELYKLSNKTFSIQKGKCLSICGTFGASTVPTVMYICRF